MSGKRERGQGPVSEPRPGPVSCGRCGTTEEQVPATWSSEVSSRGQSWLCEQCTRENLRSIEGKLDEAWW